MSKGLLDLVEATESN